MGTVRGGMTMSLDGFVSDRNGEVSSLYPDFEEFRESEMLQELMRSTGAVVMGRRSYEMGEGDFTGYEFQAPIFVVTHTIPEAPAKGENDRLTFTFVTDGIDSAVEQAKAAAGDKDVTVIGGASTIQQCIRAGLLDEIEISVMPLLLGEGLRLFEHIGADQIQLEKLNVIESSARTDLRFRVVK